MGDQVEPLQSGVQRKAAFACDYRMGRKHSRAVTQGVTTRPEIKAFTGKWTEIVIPAFRIGASDPCHALEVITAGCKPIAKLLNSLQAEHPVGFRILLVVEFTEIYEMAFKYPVQFISTARQILFRRRIFCSNCGGHKYYYNVRSSVA